MNLIRKRKSADFHIFDCNCLVFLADWNWKTSTVDSCDLREAKRLRNHGRNQQKFIATLRAKEGTSGLATKENLFYFDFPNKLESNERKGKNQKKQKSFVPTLKPRTQIHKLKRKTQTNNITTLSKCLCCKQIWGSKYTVNLSRRKNSVGMIN